MQPTPPVADVKTLIEPKPVPADDIVTNKTARAQHNADIESALERKTMAGGRLCRWFVMTGAKFPFECPKAEPK